MAYMASPSITQNKSHYHRLFQKKSSTALNWSNSVLVRKIQPYPLKTAEIPNGNIQWRLITLVQESFQFFRPAFLLFQLQMKSATGSSHLFAEWTM